MGQEFEKSVPHNHDWPSESHVQWWHILRTVAPHSSSLQQHTLKSTALDTQNSFWTCPQLQLLTQTVSMLTALVILCTVIRQLSRAQVWCVVFNAIFELGEKYRAAHVNRESQMQTLRAFPGYFTARDTPVLVVLLRRMVLKLWDTVIKITAIRTPLSQGYGKDVEAKLRDKLEEKESWSQPNLRRLTKIKVCQLSLFCGQQVTCTHGKIVHFTCSQI